MCCACCLVKLHSFSAVDFGVTVCLLQSVTTPSGSVVSSQSLMLSVTFIVHGKNAMRLQSVCKVYVVKLLNLTASQRSLLGLQSLVLSPLHRDILCPRGPEYFSTRSPPISHDKIWKVKVSSCCTLLLPFISAYGSLVLCYILFLLKHIHTDQPSRFTRDYPGKVRFLPGSRGFGQNSRKVQDFLDPGFHSISRDSAIFAHAIAS